MEKIITLRELRRLNAQVANGEISAGKMVEIINEKAKVANEAELNQILHNDIFKLKKQIDY